MENILDVMDLVRVDFTDGLLNPGQWLESFVKYRGEKNFSRDFGGLGVNYYLDVDYFPLALAEFYQFNRSDSLVIDHQWFLFYCPNPGAEGWLYSNGIQLIKCNVTLKGSGLL